ncbi:hypothetical protein P170DRAFT_454828 [Aspergillus steynii IBT 23096]|uniref:Uncharacterized protein n=1 Tax=Aspergillus steynii IBT 23096 TaxID=1392250 RepID=A0A2I2GBI1_9EURO|nr:uncharacterized protein P170DRAFT_454828 [Aspergillus steynii IBT 23096]PLB50252.1 hypothetical protein P170DRAFT_454828 [Aspergillus steynii IBT 23096]
MAKADNAVDDESADIPRGPVEARSLSAITGIASNPPAYPRNPTQKKLDPLVLYIVRVPGSKDVFLSPLKPPTKASVSAEAINSSLYYLHVATPDDQALLHEVEQEREEKARLRREMGEDADLPPELARLNNVRRKPVPGGGNNGDATKKEPPSTPPSLPVRPPMQSPSHSTASLQPPALPTRPSLSPRSSADFAGAVPQHRQDFLDNPTDDPTSARPRHPLPPLPQDEDGLDAYEENVMKKPQRWSALGGYISRGQESWKEKYEALSAGRHSLDSRDPRMRPTSAHASPSYTGMGSPGRSPGHSPTRRPQESRAPERPGFHITLIRRDPTHGSQWNVATMSTPRMDGGAIDIEVFTPGYKRFAQSEPLSLASLGVNLPSEARNSLNLPRQSESSETASSEPAQPRRFQRKLCVSRPHAPEESRGSLDVPGARPSIESLGRPSSQGGGGASKLKSGYYTFTSPWNGTCTFSTSVNGRSLKCKHMIPMPGFPPSGGGNGAPENPAVTVAEIRFNTPFQASHLPHNPGPSHTSPFSLSQTAGFKDPAALYEPDGPSSVFPPPTSKRSSLAYFFNAHAQAFTNRPRSRSGASTNSNHNPPPPSTPPFPARKPSLSSASSVDIDDPSAEPRRPLRRPPSEDRLDFSLAREPAGGGMRGKSAKLGKLVIEDEGIKMLDLVVASCMSVWWRGYYY